MDEVTISVDNLGRTAEFYIATMSAIGYGILYQSSEKIRFGVWVDSKDAEACLLEVHSTALRTDNDRNHVRFLMDSEDKLEEFLRVGILNGGVETTNQGGHKVCDEFLVAMLSDRDANKLEVICEK